MSTTITSDNGVEIKVAQLGMGVVHPEGITSIWARLSDAQRVELAAALDPGRRGLHVRLDNQASTLATYRRELDAEVIRADRAEREWGAWKARAEQAEKRGDDWEQRAHEWMKRAEPAPAVTRADIEKAMADAAPGLVPYGACVDAVHALVSGSDPVEKKARELYRAATPDARWETVADEYRRIAAHVLEQEASSDE